MTRDEVNKLITRVGGVLVAVEGVKPFAAGSPEYAKIETWIVALRSGKFAQTNGTLYRDKDSIRGPQGYCCLGVYCQAVNGADPTELIFYTMPLELVKVWSKDAKGELGETVFSPLVANFFAKLNDDLHYSFERIAQVAEVLFLGKETARTNV